MNDDQQLIQSLRLLCFEIIQRLGQKHHVILDTNCNVVSLKKETGSATLAMKRINYMRESGVSEIMYLKDMFRHFMMHYTYINQILQIWINCSNLTISFLIDELGLEFFSFHLQLNEYLDTKKYGSLAEFQNSFLILKNRHFKMPNRTIHCVIKEKFKYFRLLEPNVKVLRGWKHALIRPQKKVQKKILCKIYASHIITMIKCLNFERIEMETIHLNLKIMLHNLMPCCILFCLDTEDNISMIVNHVSEIYGQFLLKPAVYPNVFKDTTDSPPLVYFVWQKFGLRHSDEILPFTTTSSTDNKSLKSSSIKVSEKNEPMMENSKRDEKPSFPSNSENTNIEDKAEMRVNSEKIEFLNNNENSSFSNLGSTENTIPKDLKPKIKMVDDATQTESGAFQINCTKLRIHKSVQTETERNAAETELIEPIDYNEPESKQIHSRTETESFNSRCWFHNGCLQTCHCENSSDSEGNNLVIPLDRLSNETIAQVIGLLIEDSKKKHKRTVERMLN